MRLRICAAHAVAQAGLYDATTIAWRLPEPQATSATSASLAAGIVEGTTTAKAGVISALIPKTDAGVKIEGIWNATGMRGTISHTIRYDSTVGAERIIGTPGSLLSIDLSGFALGYAATYLGIGEAAFEYMVEYAKTKTLRPSTEPLAHHPLVQRTVAETGTAIRAARLLLHEAARIRMTGDTEATMLAVNQAKAYCTEVGLEATGKALRLAGGRGILKELPLERWHRDALAGPVMPPSNRRQAPVRLARRDARVRIAPARGHARITPPQFFAWQRQRKRRRGR